ncbi:MAG: alpha-N-arabinofuranosidase [Terriglobia bacterium]
MSSLMSRRQFVINGTALSLSVVGARTIFGASSKKQEVAVHADSEIGLIRPDLHGQFTEHLGSCIYGGLWVGKNSSIPNINGYRKQAVEYLRELSVPILRWPGGCFADDYHWRDGIGPLDKRPKRVNIHWGGYVEDNSFGTHEFIGLCKLIGAQPYFAGNVGSGTPEELRDWVEYCNYPSGSTLSDERAANGSPEPFGVSHWGVGNENWGCGGAMTPEEYSDLYRRFSIYLRNFGDTKLFLVACGPPSNDPVWSRGVMDGLTGRRRRLPDGFAMHYYSRGKDTSVNFTVEDMNEQLSSFALIEQAVIQQRAVLDSYDGGSKVGLILDEWGVWDRLVPEEQKRYGALWEQITMRSAIAAGLGLNLFNRQADKLYMCNIAQMVNCLQSILLTDGPAGEHCIRTTTYHAYMLFKPHRSKKALRVETADTSPLRLSVSASRQDNEIVISLVNPHHDIDLDVECSLSGATGKQASAQILHDDDFNACNTFDNPDRLVLKDHPVAIDGSRVRMNLPRLSIATAQVKVS